MAPWDPTPTGMSWWSQLTLIDEPPLWGPGTARPLCRKCLEGLGAGGGPSTLGEGLLWMGVSGGECLVFAWFSPGSREGAACRWVSW